MRCQGDFFLSPFQTQKQAIKTNNRVSVQSPYKSSLM